MRRAWLAIVLAIVGALPRLLWNLEHGWASLHLNPGASFSYAKRLRVFFSPVFPEEIGLRIVDSERWIVPVALGLVLYGCLFGLFAYGAHRSRRRDSSLLYAVAAAFPFLYALSPKATAEADPRYAMVLAPCLVLLVGQVASSYRRATAVLALAVCLSAIGLRGADDWEAAHVNTLGPTAPRTLAPLVATLERLDVKRVFANYWLAYRLDFDTNERIVAVENGFDRLVAANGDLEPPRDPTVRWRPYEDAVRAGPHAFVFFAEYQPGASALAELSRFGYRRRAVEGFVVYARR